MLKAVFFIFVFVSEGSSLTNRIHHKQTVYIDGRQAASHQTCRTEHKGNFSKLESYLERITTDDWRSGRLKIILQKSQCLFLFRKFEVVSFMEISIL